MKKITLAISCLALAAAMPTSGLQAQINREIEVTGRYIPDVGSARKIDFTPNMVDTVALRPDIRYAITPTPWTGGFETAPISPVRISTAEYRPELPVFIRLGGGLPWQSLGDLYATATTAGDLALGVYANHYGRWAKLENDQGDKNKATATRNVAGAFLEKRFSRRTLSVNIRDDFRYYKAFGGFDMSGVFQQYGASNAVIRYNDLGLDVKFGDSFRDFSRFNYRFGASASMFSNLDHYSQDNLAAFFDAGWAMYGGNFQVGAAFSIADGRDWLDGYNDWRVRLTPKYEFEFKALKMQLGLDFVYNDHVGESDFYVFPQIKLTYGAFHGFIPYLDVYGSLEDGSYASLSYANPYVKGGMYLPNSSRYGVRLGGYGSAIEAVSYDVYAGVDLWRDYNYFVNEYPPAVTELNTSYFATVSNRSANVFYVGGALSALIAKGLTFDLGLKFNFVGQSAPGTEHHYNIDSTGQVLGTEKAGLGIPQFNVDAWLRYNYREKFFVSAGVEVLGKREVSEIFTSSSTIDMINQTLPLTANLKFEMEYRINRRFNIFVLGDNLLDQKIYDYAHYRGLGANFMLGVKLLF